LIGRPNVGKSSLLNALLRQPRAIVSAIAGTTRDTIEETAQIDGVPLQLVDTAGILEPRDSIEEEAVRRSRLNLAQADLVLLILENQEPLSQADKNLIADVRERDVLVVINKCDLPDIIIEKEIAKYLPHKTVLRISALDGRGIDQLRKAILDQALHGSIPEGHGILISNLRHTTALQEAREAAGQAAKIFHHHQSPEIASEEIKRAVNALDAITGRHIDQDLIDQIFSAFCIGK
jgi:tRNA modification GTPase